LRAGKEHITAGKVVSEMQVAERWSLISYNRWHVGCRSSISI